MPNAPILYHIYIDPSNTDTSLLELRLLQAQHQQTNNNNSPSMCSVQPGLTSSVPLIMDTVGNVKGKFPTSATQTRRHSLKFLFYLFYFPLIVFLRPPSFRAGGRQMITGSHFLFLFFNLDTCRFLIFSFSISCSYSSSRFFYDFPTLSFLIWAIQLQFSVFIFLWLVRSFESWEKWLHKCCEYGTFQWN